MDNLTNIKILLEIDSDIYDDKLNIIIPSAVEKMSLEGVAEIKPDEEYYNMYLTCLSYQTAVDLALDVDYNTMYRKYMTFVNTLRSRIIWIN